MAANCSESSGRPRARLPLREDVAAKRALLDAAKERAATLPHRERHLRLVHRLGDLLLDAHEHWLDEVEQELAQP